MSAGDIRAPSRSTEAWTESRLDALTRLWLGGTSATQIAAQLGGVSRSAVLGKIHRLGLGRPAAPPERPKTPRPPKPRKSRARAPRTTQAQSGSDHHARREVPRLARPVRTLIVAANGNIYPAPPPTPLPPLRVVDAANPKPLLALEPDDCRHPINDGDDPRHGWLYCAEPVIGPARDKGEYCARCRTILFDHERTAMANAKAGQGRQARAVGATRRHGRGDSVWLR